MPNKINNHVNKLNASIPFGPDHGEIYEEHKKDSDSIMLGVTSLGYILEVLKNTPPLIILTGDAGHGKTHMCLQIIKKYLGYEETKARKLLNSQCRGQIIEPTQACAGNIPLQIYKDISELSSEDAEKGLSNSLENDGATTIICVNEGRLRSILARGSSNNLKNIRDLFDDSFYSGLVTQDERTYIINLNYQSVVSRGGGFVKDCLAGWLDKRKWGVCSNCDSREACPILLNFEMLSDKNYPQRQNRLIALFGILECLGVVVTIRQMLISIAYLLTGGLRCEDVHRQSRKPGWQYEYVYYRLFFIPPHKLSSGKVESIRPMKYFAKLDPGSVAIRSNDERLINSEGVYDQGSIDLIFSIKIGGKSITIDASNGIDEIIGNPRNKKEREEESKFINYVVRSLRRRDFFDSTDEEFDASRLGFENYGEFSWLLKDESDAKRKLGIKTKVIRGLHVLQGLKIPGAESTLQLVDPAFGNSTTHAAIIAAKVPLSKIKIIPLWQRWKISDTQKENSIMRATDWSDRYVVLAFEIDNDEPRFLLLDYISFECITRASGGYIPQGFYAHDIRRIINFLGSMAEQYRVDVDTGIDVVVKGKPYSISIDEGHMISVNAGL